MYDEATKQLNLIKKNVEKIQSSLVYLSGVPDKGIMIDTRMPMTKRPCRILDNAIGISSQYHILYKIVARANPGEYEIVGTFKSHKYRLPMVYVDENEIGRIKEYQKSAGLIVDRAVKEEFTPKQNKRETTLKGVSGRGTRYSAIYRNGKYNVTFKCTGVDVSFDYDPVIDPTSDYSTDFYKMEISGCVDEIVVKNKMSKMLKEIGHA
jgi:hypothetical protein